jgi:hypothetical protein
LRFLPLLAITDDGDREETFDDVRDAEDWCGVTASKYWSAMTKAGEAVGWPLSFVVRVKGKLLACLAKEEEQKRPTVPLTEGHMAAALRHMSDLQSEVAATAFILGQRTGDTLQLKAGCLSVVEDAATSAKFLAICYKRGKTVRRRQPYSVHLPEDSVLAKSLLLRQKGVQSGDLLFGNDPLSTLDAVVRALKAQDPSYCALSIRKGGLQAMALHGVSEAAMLHHSRHTSLEMLNRYLGWGQVNLAAARERFGVAPSQSTVRIGETVSAIMNYSRLNATIDEQSKQQGIGAAARHDGGTTSSE